MIDYLGFNLTQYKSFRQLQFQYTKLKSENESLNFKLAELNQLYGEKCKQIIAIKTQDMEQKLNLKNKNLKYKKLYRDLVESVQASIGCISGVQKHPIDISNISINQTQMIENMSCISQSPEKSVSNIPKHKNSKLNNRSIFIAVEQSQSLQTLINKLQQSTKQYLSLEQQNKKLSKQLESQKIEFKSQSLQKQKAEVMIVKQIERMESQLQELHQQNMELQAKLRLREKDNKKLNLQLVQIKSVCEELQSKLDQLQASCQSNGEESPEFALDFLTFQIHSMQQLFAKVIESTKVSQDLSSLLSILYNDYQELSQVFRQKLQIQYDLEELEQRYRQEKTESITEESLLIQTRRQIQTFRLELLKHKEIFRQKESHLQEHLSEYLKKNEEELKIKNYSYELENRLYQQKRSQLQTKLTSRNPTARDIIFKRLQHNKQPMNEFINSDKETKEELQQPEYQQLTKKPSLIKFKPSNNVEELMKQIVKKDKVNLEKILKQTRKTSVSLYLSK